MKVTLLCTTSLCAAGFINTANAAEWDIKIGGYFESHLAFASVDSPAGTDFDGVDVSTDAEIFFLPSITLDNGLKIGANIQLEGNTSSDQIDESFIYIKGSFGEVLIGSENSAGYKMTYGAPDVTFINVNSGSMTSFIPFSGSAGGANVGDDVFRRTLGSTFIENSGNNDAARITYFTPRFAGFQLGASYARNPNEDNGPVNNNTQLHDIFDIGANYVNSFGGFDIAISGRWGIAKDPISNTKPEIWGAGINLGFNLGQGVGSSPYSGSSGPDGKITLGGSFADQDGTQSMDGQAYDIGLSYETGPWGVSLTYFHGKNADNEHAGFGFTEELDQYLLGVSYKIAEGVKLNAFGAYVDFDEQLNDAAAPGGDDVSGFVIGTGIKLTF